MSINLDELERMAMETTPGPWVVDPDDPARVISRCPCCGLIATCSVFGPLGSTSPKCYNTSYIAAANPSAVLALIARLREAERLLGEARHSRDCAGVAGESDGGKK